MAYTSRFSFGHGQTDPVTGVDLLDRYVTIVDHADDANADRNRERMFQLWGREWSWDYDESSWAALDTRWRDGWTEYARFEFGAPQGTTPPPEVVAKVKAGHTLEWDPLAAPTSARRWTCKRCSQAVLMVGTSIYGGVTVRTCDEGIELWKEDRK